ncbi:translation initiation factor IF-2-like [Cygnus atratus]|uniref:translation initiation factor IF-2-like n=1 Tax=Cygnus atratus TaxID=8868 RepID=UPI0021B6FC31|nr:translation initiation factor IF-2-like [Cygnus atratus]
MTAPGIRNLRGALRQHHLVLFAPALWAPEHLPGLPPAPPHRGGSAAAGGGPLPAPRALPAPRPLPAPAGPLGSSRTPRAGVAPGGVGQAGGAGSGDHLEQDFESTACKILWRPSTPLPHIMHVVIPEGNGSSVYSFCARCHQPGGVRGRRRSSGAAGTCRPRSHGEGTGTAAAVGPSAGGAGAGGGRCPRRGAGSRRHAVSAHVQSRPVPTPREAAGQEEAHRGFFGNENRRCPGGAAGGKEGERPPGAVSAPASLRGCRKAGARRRACLPRRGASAGPAPPRCVPAGEAPSRKSRRPAPRPAGLSGPSRGTGQGPSAAPHPRVAPARRPCPPCPIPGPRSHGERRRGASPGFR